MGRRGIGPRGVRPQPGALVPRPRSVAGPVSRAEQARPALGPQRQSAERPGWGAGQKAEGPRAGGVWPWGRTGTMPGVLSMRSNHTGFQGSVKTSASDFIVTEIDTLGLLLSDSTAKTPCALGDTPAAPNSCCPQSPCRPCPGPPELHREEVLGPFDSPSHAPEAGLSPAKGSTEHMAGTAPEGGHHEAGFTLRKENLETLEAIGYLSSELGVLPSDFSYTGIKDKKAITYQAMVVKKVTPERLKEIGSTIEKKGMKVYNIHSVCQHLKLGQLKGNHFDIIVRDLKHQSNDSSADLKERISEAIENVKTKGFVNYYGPQRFGHGQNVQTDQIGLALLNEEMVKAVKLFFTPEDTDDPVNQAKRYFLQSDDAKGTLAMLPKFKVREKMLLRALNRYGLHHEGCTQGWLSIPHSMRIFYVHAYCSKIWNEAASFRFLTYGSKVVEGDLVLSEDNVGENSSLNDRVHVVTAPEESANKYAIHQVVLPMVGHSIKYPNNKVGQWYHERLAKDGLQTCSFRVSALQLNTPGCYRHILKYIHNLSYHFLEDNKKGIKTEEDSYLNESKASLLLSFDLDPSCYATVCLREIMKCDL
ncbi:pseudouridylate synthase 7 homolog-like protein isoform X4 [Dermochelys coriacea]|uniref:pseudouridylate synthase 7 homolog-like protein isoform X4 n=1 Tax=Dermochelys coriacea TaxID=27794 RepID=UPI0018E7471C|nr:pseudouridylate synthase 7 homolog-like protein isoform X4 [Dermochelys coriacea]